MTAAAAHSAASETRLFGTLDEPTWARILPRGQGTTGQANPGRERPGWLSKCWPLVAGPGRAPSATRGSVKSRAWCYRACRNSFWFCLISASCAQWISLKKLVFLYGQGFRGNGRTMKIPEKRCVTFRKISGRKATATRFLKAFKPFWDGRAIGALLSPQFRLIVIAALQKHGIEDTIRAS